MFVRYTLYSLLLFGILSGEASGAESKIVSPLFAGANQEFREAGIYYGTLPYDNPESRRSELKDTLNQAGIKAIRFPGGTQANWFFVDNNEAMNVFPQTGGRPEGKRDLRATLWQFLDFCKETGIEPIYQINMISYAEGPKVYLLSDIADERWRKPGVVVDPSKRTQAAEEVGRLVTQVRKRGYRIRHWELGNEEYAQMERNPQDYAEIALRFARAIRRADPKAHIWITLSDNGLLTLADGRRSRWAESVLKRLSRTNLTKDPKVGFTLHYSWRAVVDDAAKMVKKYGFQPRFAITEFHMAGNGPYTDLCPRFGYALDLAKYLVEMVSDPRVKMLCIHCLIAQNFGIIHYNQRSYGPPGMETWDPKLGYQIMPSGHVYGLFGELVGGTMVSDATTKRRLVVRKNGTRVIFFVNDTMNPVTIQWDGKIIGNEAKSFVCRTITAADKTHGDPRRVDRIVEEKQQGPIRKARLHLTLPSLSISVVQCDKRRNTVTKANH